MVQERECHVQASAKPGHALARKKATFSSSEFEGRDQVRLDFWVSDDLALYTQSTMYVNDTGKHVNSIATESRHS